MTEYQALLRFSKGSAHRTISFPEIITFHVALPPIEEQLEVVRLLDIQLSRIDKNRVFTAVY